MKDAADYLAHIKALIVANRQVAHWTVVREEAQGDMGLFRSSIARESERAGRQGEDGRWKGERCTRR